MGADKVCFCEISEDVHEKGCNGASVHGSSEQGSSSGVHAASGCEICLQDASGNKFVGKQKLFPLSRDGNLLSLLSLHALQRLNPAHFLQFAGGFDPETMDAFEELRNLVHVRNSTQ